VGAIGTKRTKAGFVIFEGHENGFVTFVTEERRWRN